MILSTPEEVENMSSEKRAIYLKSIETYFAHQRVLIQRMHDNVDSPVLDAILANIDRATEELKEAANAVRERLQ